MPAKSKTFLFEPDTEFAGVTLSPKRYYGHDPRYADRRREDDGIIDTVAVVRALRGEIVPLSNREIIAAIALGAKQGLSDGELSERLGLSARRIEIKRNQNNIPPSQPHMGGSWPRKEDAA